MSGQDWTPACTKCDGTGQWVEHTRYEFAGPGGTVMVSEGSSSHLCECRATLPPREGRAHWWSLRSVYSEVVDIPIGRDTVEIGVRTEVPISAENFPVVRRGNRYYPTTVDVEIGNRSLTLHGDTARLLAQRLIEAADACDRADLPDTDVCGHWAPCDCGQKAI